MKTTLYLTHSVLIKSSRNYEAIEAIRKWMGWPEPELIVGIEPLARITRGRFNPASDLVLTAKTLSGADGIIARNPVDLCVWIHQQGLTPL